MRLQTNLETNWFKKWTVKIFFGWMMGWGVKAWHWYPWKGGIVWTTIFSVILLTGFYWLMDNNFLSDFPCFFDRDYHLSDFCYTNADFGRQPLKLNDEVLSVKDNPLISAINYLIFTIWNFFLFADLSSGFGWGLNIIFTLQGLWGIFLVTTLVAIISRKFMRM